MSTIKFMELNKKLTCINKNHIFMLVFKYPLIQNFLNEISSLLNPLLYKEKLKCKKKQKPHNTIHNSFRYPYAQLLL